MTKLIILKILLISTAALAQKEANVWYFGKKAGLDFNNGTPVALTDGSLITIEGCSSIADSKGNLLFYSEGVHVWDRNHVQMPDGFGLLGDESSTQSALIVPKPGSNTIYYIFTTAAWGPPTGSLCYSIVDMTLNSGLGNVTSKNVYLHAPVTDVQSRFFTKCKPIKRLLHIKHHFCGH